MSYIVDDDSKELTTNELLLLILKELQVQNLHSQQASDVEFSISDVEDQIGG